MIFCALENIAGTFSPVCRAEPDPPQKKTSRAGKTEPISFGLETSFEPDNAGYIRASLLLIRAGPNVFIKKKTERLALSSPLLHTPLLRWTLLLSLLIFFYLSSATNSDGRSQIRRTRAPWFSSSTSLPLPMTIPTMVSFHWSLKLFIWLGVNFLSFSQWFYQFVWGVKGKTNGFVILGLNNWFKIKFKLQSMVFGEGI